MRSRILRAGNLRKYFISDIAAIILLGVLASLAAVSESWSVAIVLTHGSLLFAVLSVLLSARYVVRLLRTQERKSKLTAERIARLSDESVRLLKESARREQESYSALHRLNESTQHVIGDAIATSIGDVNEKTQDSVLEIKRRLGELDTTVRKTAQTQSRHVTSTVRDSTRQVESLVQIYTRFKDLKIPMPNTGGFAIDSQALGHLLSLVEERRPKKILELGSGASTIWLGYLCQSFGGELVTLDHLEGYLDLTRTAVDRHGLHDHVESRLAPLEPVESAGDTYNWYSLASLNDLSDIELVLIDGPPAATGPKARYPALPYIIDLLAPHATVILDDAHRQEEADIIEEWLHVFPDFRQIEVGTSRLAVLERTA